MRTQMGFQSFTHGMAPRQDEVVDSKIYFLIVTDPDEDDITVIDHRRIAQPPKSTGAG